MLKLCTTYHNKLFRDLVILLLVFVSRIVFSSIAFAAETVQFEVTIARASRSGTDVDSRLAFVKARLLGYGYRSATYVRGSRFSLAEGKSERFSVDGRISGLLQMKSLQGRDVVQFNLSLYSGSRREFDAVYTMARRGGTALAVLTQPGGSAYIVIVRALR